MDWIDEALDFCIKKVDFSSERIKDSFPHTCTDGKLYNFERARSWISGYWPGILWMAYNETGNKKFMEYALGCGRQLDTLVSDHCIFGHDIGFMWLLTFKPDFVLNKNEDAKRKIIFIATILAGRFNLQGNFIRAWSHKSNFPGDETGWAIIDCTMNIPILFLASQFTGDPRFAHIAKKHADTVLKRFLREDGSVNHICMFDPETGEFLGSMAGQGYSSDSAWSRGASWCIHGLALAYGYTGEARYLEGAKKAADFFFNNLPDDYVPYWDFRAPCEQKNARDASAGANAASGMLEIALYCSGAEKEKYEGYAKKILKSLWENYTVSDMSAEPILSASTVNYPEGLGINCSLIYADYYFMEALLKLKGKKEIYNW